MEIPDSIKLIMGAYAGIVGGFLLAQYGVLPVGIILGFIIIFGWDFFEPDQDDFKN